jgi:hypothetical protein
MEAVLYPAVVVETRREGLSEGVVNIELLKKIKAHVLASPKSFRMDHWNCGTAMCIAGWACALTGQRWALSDDDIRVLVSDENPGTVAADALDIGPFQPHMARDRHAAATRLFFVNAWPEQFQGRYDRERYDEDGEPREDVDYAGLAQIAAERIDHFIATNGQE